MQLPSPQDDATLKHLLWQDSLILPSVEIDREKLYKLEEVLRSCGESDLIRAFGPVGAIDDSYVLPCCRHAGVGFSGVGYKGKGNKYFLPIGDVGGVLVFPFGDRDLISTVALYLKTDGAFQPLKKPSDFMARREWELKKIDELKSIIRSAMKNTD